MSLLFLLAFFCKAEHTVQDEMQQCNGSSVLFDEDLLCHVVAIHTISATRPTSSDITLVTMITMMTNVTQVINNLRMRTGLMDVSLKYFYFNLLRNDKILECQPRH